MLTTQNEIDNLTKMRYRMLIDDEEFLTKETLLAKLEKPKEELGDTQRRAENWLELTERTFDFITYAAANFKRGDYEGRRTIYSKVWGNLHNPRQEARNAAS